MSARVVSKRHIDLIVQVAVYGPVVPGPGPQWCHAFAYYHRRGAEPHPGYLYQLHCADTEAHDRTGRMLWDANRESVAHRYRERPYPLPYQFPVDAPRVTAVEALKALDGYEHHSCEHPGWRDSEARAFIDALRETLIPKLDGYREAETWTVGEAFRWGVCAFPGLREPT
jgi:hypothetical protein